LVSYPNRRPSAGPWLQGASAVAVLSFDVDAESPILAEDERYAEDLSAMSHQAYGPRVGIPRILDLLGSHSVEGTFFVPGVTAERWPETVQAIVGAGHEVALHGHSHRVLPGMAEDEQRRDLEWGLEALAGLGVQPRGYRAPYWRLTRPALDLLARHGIRYDSSLMDDDRPYRLSTAAGEVAELPVHWSLDDWEQYAFLPEPDIGQRIENPRDVVEIWKGELDAMRRTNSLCVLTCHPFLSGRPSRVQAIEDFIEFARNCSDVRFSRADRLADLILGDAENGA
jgi:peptidoglycan/xylan/chitin deacetylase (PgdA/CDA1 family)